MKLALDADVLWAFFQKDKAVAELIDAQSIIYIPATVAGELMAAVRQGSRPAQNQTVLKAFFEDEAVEILQIGAETAEFYARLEPNTLAAYRWTAALCLEHGCELATRDEHYQKIAPLLTIKI